MKKSLTIIVIIVVIAAVIVGTKMFTNNEEVVLKSNFAPVENAAGLSTIIDNVYAGISMEMPMVATQEHDVTDSDTVTYVTGLENGEKLEYLVSSDPMMSSQAYSFVLAKVKEGINAEEVAKEMSDKIDTRKWICVSAEKLYATNSGDIVCLIMSSEELAKPIYEKFKELAGTVGQEFEKTEEAPELPEDMMYEE